MVPPFLPPPVGKLSGDVLDAFLSHVHPISLSPVPVSSLHTSTATPVLGQQLLPPTRLREPLVCPFPFLTLCSVHAFAPWLERSLKSINWTFLLCLKPLTCFSLIAFTQTCIPGPCVTIQPCPAPLTPLLTVLQLHWTSVGPLQMLPRGPCMCCSRKYPSLHFPPPAPAPFSGLARTSVLRSSVSHTISLTAARSPAEFSTPALRACVCVFFVSCPFSPSDSELHEDRGHVHNCISRTYYHVQQRLAAVPWSSVQ